MKRGIPIVVAASALLTAPLCPPARAGCGAASCPSDTTSLRPVARRWMRLGYEFEYIDQDRPFVRDRRASVGEIGGEHDERYTTNRIHRLAASAGITERLGVELQLPFISRSHGHLHRHEDGDLEDQGWSLFGVGDLAARLRWALLLDEGPGLGTWSVILGAKFPTGRTRAANESGTEAETGILPGSGSYDLIAGASWRKDFEGPTLAGGSSAWPVYWTATYRSNGPGVDGYRLGDAFQANVGAAYPFFDSVGALFAVDWLIKRRDWQGLTREETQKTGGEYVYLSPGLLWRITDRWEAATLVQVPVYRRVNEIQLTSRYNLLASLAYRFPL